jgi:hypothetical protein
VLSRIAAAARAGLPALGLAFLASCGGEDPQPPDERPAALLRQAAAQPPSSGDAEIAVDVVLEGDSLLAGPANLALSGPFALDPSGGLPRFDFEMDAEVAGFGVEGSLVSTGDDAFVVFFGENYRVGPERTAELEEALRATAGRGDTLRFDEWIRDPRYEEVDEVGGADAVRIAGVANPEAAIGDLAGVARTLGVPTELLERAELLAGPAEAWVALDDRVLRRVRVQLAFSVPAPLRPQVSGLEAGALTLEAEVSDVGAEVTVEPPPGGGFQPIEDLTDRIAGLAGLAL